jgi:hypothetical protein
VQNRLAVVAAAAIAFYVFIGKGVISMTAYEEYRLAWAGLEGFVEYERRAGGKRRRADRFEVAGDLEIPAFLKRECRFGFEYLGKGRDGEDCYRCPGYALELLAKAKLTEYRGAADRRH